MSDQPAPFEADATLDAAHRLVAFLEQEVELLPKGHSWRINYQRQLIHMRARYPATATAEE